MIFSSPIFLTLFLPLVLGLYFVSSERFRKYILLVFSLAFYAWGEPKAIFCLLGMSIANYYLGLIIEKKDKLKKTILIFGVVLDLSALFVYKYLDFAIFNINGLLGTSWKIPGIELPIGISFYCFQCLSYLVDIYRGQVDAQKKLSNFVLYISFFPQLIAGPIVRYIDVKQCLDQNKIDLNNVYQGLARFVYGLAKKVLIADPNGYIADQVFSLQPAEISQSWCWIGIICYSLQIYFDFSAYSDMAIGLGKIFNFSFLENFKHPYHSLSIQEFWRKWHISLSTWLRDYVYIPLGGSRKGKVRTYINVWVVFLLCGLWHGAEWTFVIWGAWHGLGLMIERLGLNKILNYLHPSIRLAWVLLFVMIGWVFFRSPNFSYATSFILGLFGFNEPGQNFFTNVNLYANLNIFFILSFLFGIFLCFDWTSNKVIISICNCMKKYYVFDIYILALFIISITFAITSNFSPFIYFRF